MAPRIDPRSVSPSASPEPSNRAAQTDANLRSSNERGSTTPQQRAAHARQRPTESLAARGQRSPGPSGVEQGSYGAEALPESQADLEEVDDVVPRRPFSPVVGMNSLLGGASPPTAGIAAHPADFQAGLTATAPMAGMLGEFHPFPSAALGAYESPVQARSAFSPVVGMNSLLGGASPPPAGIPAHQAHFLAGLTATAPVVGMRRGEFHPLPPAALGAHGSPVQARSAFSPVVGMNRLLGGSPPVQVAPATAAGHGPTPWVEDYWFFSSHDADQVARDAMRRQQARPALGENMRLTPPWLAAPGAPELTAEDFAAERWAPHSNHALSVIEAFEFVGNLLPAAQAEMLVQPNLAPLRTFMAALPFSPQGQDPATARRVLDQARCVMRYVADPRHEHILQQCVAIARRAIETDHNGRIEPSFAAMQRMIVNRSSANSAMAQLEHQPPSTPVGLVHLRSRFGNRRATSMNYHRPVPGQHPTGYFYISLSPAHQNAVQDAARHRLLLRNQADAPEQQPWSPSDIAVARWGRPGSMAESFLGAQVAEEFLNNVVPRPLWDRLANNAYGVQLLAMFAGLPFGIDSGDGNWVAQHDLFTDARQASEALLALSEPNASNPRVFDECLAIAGTAHVTRDGALRAFEQIRQHLLGAGMRADAFPMPSFSGELQLFENVYFREAPFVPQSPEQTQAAAVEQAMHLWAGGAEPLSAEHVDEFLTSILPLPLRAAVSQIENGQRLLELFAGLRMTTNRANPDLILDLDNPDVPQRVLDPVMLRMTTDQARQALDDLERYRDWDLLSLSIGIAKEVVCADSLQLCFTQIRTALVNHAATLGDGRPESVFAAVRPSFNQAVVENMAVEFSQQSERVAAEAVEYYAQLVGEVRKQVSLVESATGHRWGDLQSYHLPSAELSAAAEHIVARIREQTNVESPHFLDFFASHPAWQKIILRTPTNAAEHQAVIAARDRASDAFDNLAPEQQAEPEALTRMQEASNLESDWFRAKTKPLLAPLVRSLNGAL